MYYLCVHVVCLCVYECVQKSMAQLVFDGASKDFIWTTSDRYVQYAYYLLAFRCTIYVLFSTWQLPKDFAARFRVVIRVCFDGIDTYLRCIHRRFFTYLFISACGKDYFNADSAGSKLRWIARCCNVRWRHKTGSQIVWCVSVLCKFGFENSLFKIF